VDGNPEPGSATPFIARQHAEHLRLAWPLALLLAWAAALTTALPAGRFEALAATRLIDAPGGGVCSDDLGFEFGSRSRLQGMLLRSERRSAAARRVPTGCCTTAAA